jgi:hypothetical protein
VDELAAGHLGPRSTPKPHDPLSQVLVIHQHGVGEDGLDIECQVEVAEPWSAPPQIGLIELVRAWGGAGVVGVSSDEVASSAFGSERRVGLRLSGRQAMLRVELAALRVEVAAGLAAGAGWSSRRRRAQGDGREDETEVTEETGAAQFGRFFWSPLIWICREYLISCNRSAQFHPNLQKVEWNCSIHHT